MLFTLLQVDYGASGYGVTLRVCNIDNKEIIEEISLRGEDYLPKIDSIVENNVYIHYTFPRNTNDSQSEVIDFESVVLGDALINKSFLKYNYLFLNTKG